MSLKKEGERYQVRLIGTQGCAHVVNTQGEHEEINIYEL